MSGCGNTKTLKCTANRSVSNYKNDAEAKVEYQDDNVKYVTITYDYNQDNNTVTGNATITTTDENGTTTTTTTTDGVNAETDGLTTDENNQDNNISSNEVIDGVVGNTLDTVINGVTDTIMDIAGIKNSYENQFSTYDDIEGFSYKVDVDEENEYKVIYKIDMEKISDNDLARFNLDRNLNTLKSNYEGLGYTCEDE